MLAFCGRDPRLSFLEEGSTKVSRSTGELRTFERLLNSFPSVKYNYRGAADKDGKNISMTFLELREGLAEIPHIKVRQRTQER